MKAFPIQLIRACSVFLPVRVAAASLLIANVALAQAVPDLAELERLLEEQRMALEEALSEREATAAKAADVLQELEAAEEHRRLVEEEVKMLCESQESLSRGSFEECMNK